MILTKIIRLRYVVALTIVLMSVVLNAQVVYEHISNTSIYLFLDELEAEQVIHINSTAKPYSRKFIYEKLIEAKESAMQLTSRQKEEIDFYLRSFGYGRSGDTSERQLWNDENSPVTFNLNPIAITAQDKGVIAMVRPIVGVDLTINSNGSFYQNTGGVGATVELGKNLGVYFALVDHSSNFQTASPYFLQQYQAAPVRVFTEDFTHSDIYGGIVYNWKWGSVGIVKEHVEWGPNYNGSNIISSSNNPAIPMLKFDLNPAKWIEFSYFHGWLNSGIFDTLYTDGKGTVREYAEPRFIAANLVQIKPWPHTNISVGNSVIYGSQGLNIGYLNPIMFYRPVDYQNSSFNDYAGANGQMYFSVSTRVIKHLHAYTSVFVDELSVSEMFSKEDNHNQISFKAGLNVTGLVPNTAFTFEYTRNNPWVYNHFQEITLFETNEYNLGHYLRENAQDIYLNAHYSPIARLCFDAHFNLAQKGPEAEQGVYSGLPFLEKTNWEKREIGLKASYQFSNNAFVYAKFVNNNISGDNEYIQKYTQPIYYSIDDNGQLNGKTNSISIGVMLGL